MTAPSQPAHEQHACAKAATLLGVSPTAPPEILRSAWRAAARREHPDRGGPPERFHAVHAAYELLTTTPAATPTTPHTAPPPSAPHTGTASTGTAPDGAAVPQRRAARPVVIPIVGLLVVTGAFIAAVAAIAAPVTTLFLALTTTILAAQHTYHRLVHPSSPPG